jgi:hypothetical protein
MRLITGVIFGIGIVWFLFPHVEVAMNDLAQRMNSNFRKLGLAITPRSRMRRTKFKSIPLGTAWKFKSNPGPEKVFQEV